MIKYLRGFEVHYRHRGDERILDEVFVKACYRRIKFNFDVECGERWLDLGANIGAFALYCKSRGAVADCWEPEQDNFELLKRNVPEFVLHNSAISAQLEETLDFWDNSNPEDGSRGTLIEVSRFKKTGKVRNTWAGLLSDQFYDGIKIDIEGAEGPLIDEWLLPKCNKLVLEYSTSRDHSAVNLERRLNIIKSKFKEVSYPAEYDRAIEIGGRIMTHPPNIIRFDRLIFAKEPR